MPSLLDFGKLTPAQQEDYLNEQKRLQSPGAFTNPAFRPPAQPINMPQTQPASSLGTMAPPAQFDLNGLFSKPAAGKPNTEPSYSSGLTALESPGANPLNGADLGGIWDKITGALPGGNNAAPTGNGSGGTFNLPFNIGAESIMALINMLGATNVTRDWTKGIDEARGLVTKNADELKDLYKTNYNEQKDMFGQVRTDQQNALDQNYNEQKQLNWNVLQDQKANLAPWLQSGRLSLDQLNAGLQPGGGLADGYTKEFTHNQTGPAAPGTFSFNAKDLENNPAYQFRLNEAVKRITAEANANGTRFSGATLKAIGDRAALEASQELENEFGRQATTYGINANEYSNVFGRDLAAYQTGENTFRQNQQDRFSRLKSLADMGQQATTQDLAATGDYGTKMNSAADQHAGRQMGVADSYATRMGNAGDNFTNRTGATQMEATRQISDLVTARAQAEAAGDVARLNAINNAITSLLDTYNQSKMFDAIGKIGAPNPITITQTQNNNPLPQTPQIPGVTLPVPPPTPTGPVPTTPTPIPPIRPTPLPTIPLPVPFPQPQPGPLPPTGTSSTTVRMGEALGNIPAGTVLTEMPPLTRTPQIPGATAPVSPGTPVGPLSNFGTSGGTAAAATAASLAPAALTSIPLSASALPVSTAAGLMATPGMAVRPIGGIGAASSAGGSGASGLVPFLTNPITIGVAAAAIGAISWVKSQAHWEANTWVNGFQKPFDQKIDGVNRQFFGLAEQGQLDKQSAQQIRDSVSEAFDLYEKKRQDFATKGKDNKKVADQAKATFDRYYGNMLSEMDRVIGTL